MAAERVIIQITGDTTSINSTISELEKLGKVDIKNRRIFDENNRRFNENLNKTKDNLGVFGDQLNSLKQQVIGAFAVTSIVAFGKEAVATAAKIESIGNSLKFITGSSANAEKTMTYLRELSNRLGLEFESTAQAFKLFAGATTQAGMTLGQTKSIFESVSKAVTTMGLSADDANGVFLALSQIMSKGKVSAEELRGQIGERIPGAFSIAAKSIGVTEQQLNKMLEQGQILSKDFLPKFAKQLETDLGGGAENAANAMQANLNRLSNMWTDFKNFFGANIVYPLLNAMKGLFVDYPKMFIDDLSRVFKKKDIFDLPELKAQFQTVEDNFTKLSVRVSNAKTIKDLEVLGSTTNKYFNSLSDGMKKAANSKYTQVMDELAEKYKTLTVETANAGTAIDQTKKKKEEDEKQTEKQLTAYERLVKASSDLEAAMRNTLALNGIVSPEAIKQLDDLKLKIQTIEIAMKNLNDPALKNAGGQPLGIKGVTPEQLPSGDFGAAAEKQQYAELLSLHEEFLKELGTQDQEYSQAYYKELEQRQQAEKAIYEELPNIAMRAIDSIMALQQAQTQWELQNLDDQLKNKQISETQYEQKKRAVLRQQAEDQKTAAIFQATLSIAEAVLKAYEQGGPYAGPILAAIVGALGAVQLAAISAAPLPQYAEGTDFVALGKNKKGKDTIPAMLNEGEAVIKTDENLKYPGLSKAWNEGKLEEHIYNKWVLPEMIMKRSYESEKQRNFANNIGRSIQLNQDFGGLESKLKKVADAEKEGAIYIGKKIDKAFTKNLRGGF